jgi:response regulator RpfG family c-di-GMP phosphodiesterase
MDRILVVDDEPSVLSGFERTLRNEFEVTTASSGEEGLAAMRELSPFAVVISDMRMPGMNGAQFLTKAKALAPDTVRMLLTGYTDLNAAIEAVNEGNIFRFLTKPCVKEFFISMINSGVEQYQLIRSEKDLLENTLMGSIKVLTEILSVSSPEAFGRSKRIVNIVSHLATRSGLKFSWKLEAAASLSLIGCITLDTALLQRAFVGMTLSLEDQTRFDAHPQAAEKLLREIPRLEPVAWMVGQQLIRGTSPAPHGISEAIINETVVGAKLLKLAVAFDNLRMKSLSNEEAITRLQNRTGEFDQQLVNALVGIKLGKRHMEARKVSNAKLATGMVLDQEIRNQQGMLMVAKGQEITRALLMKLENFAQAGMLDRELMVMMEV